MSTTMKKPKPCAFRSCNRVARARGFCEAHYQALFVRKTPVHEVLRRESAHDRVKDAVPVMTRIEREDLELLKKAITQGKIKEPQYAFLKRVITEAIRAL